MERDFQTKGVLLIKTKFGIVSATRDNFDLSILDMTINQTWQNEVGAETGVFCLTPWELEDPIFFKKGFQGKVNQETTIPITKNQINPL